MTIRDNDDGTYTLTLSLGEQTMLARAEQRHGVTGLRDAVSNWLQRAGGLESEIAELNEAYLAADPATRSEMLTLIADKKREGL
jgi:ABC-type thiamine transport system ATPase subunit